MPRLVALLLCVVFIRILFWMDPRQKTKDSWMLWIPSFWMLIIASRMVSQWFAGWGNSSADAYADGSPMDRNIFLSLILMAVVIVAKRRVSIQEMFRHNPWIGFYLVYCAASIVWSDFPLVSFKRYTKEFGNLLMAVIVLTEADPLEAMLTLLKRCAYILVPFSILLFKYFSEFGRSYSRWTGELSMVGVTNNKNSLGVLCAVSAIGLYVCLYEKWKDKSWSFKDRATQAQLVGFALTIWVLITAHSATSIGCCAVGIAIVTASRIEMIRRNIQLYSLATVVLVAVVYFSGTLVSATAGALGRDSTLTGRTEIWGKVVEMTDNPLMGGGYSSFWLGDRLEQLWSEYAWHPTEAHDGYLEIYIDLGIIGVTLIGAIIISAFRTTTKVIMFDPALGALRLAMLAAAILYNITESAFRPGLLMYFFFLIVVLHIPRPSQDHEWQTSDDLQYSQ